MKKGLINEAFRLQQIAGIAPINENGFQNEENGGYDFQPDVDKAAHMLAKDYMREEGIEDEDEALNYAAKEIIEYLEQMYTQYMEGAKPGLQQEAYMENMGPDLEKAMFLIQKAWNHIKNNPALENSDITSQREGILSHIEELLDY